MRKIQMVNQYVKESSHSHSAGKFKLQLLQGCILPYSDWLSSKKKKNFCGEFLSVPAFLQSFY